MKMEIFSRHELIKTNDGYTLVLYADKYSGEFAEDFFSRLDSKRKELPKDTLDYIKNFIYENYQGIKINSVNIMLGSLLVASIAYNPANAYISSLLTEKPTVLQGNSEYAGTANNTEPLNKLENIFGNLMYPRKQLKMQGKKEIQPSDPQVIENDNLILVNKTHSLPRGYVPKNLTSPKVAKVNSSKTMMVPEAAGALEALFEKARQDNISLTAISGYRSFKRQDAIFASNTNKYGSAAAANQFSARPGESEHQTGLAMDVSSPSVNFALTQRYADTREGKWLKENAPQFGFIIRYQRGKESITGYQFEPWHLRYVGRAASLEIAGRNITLEEFLGKT